MAIFQLPIKLLFVHKISVNDRGRRRKMISYEPIKIIFIVRVFFRRQRAKVHS